MSTSSGLHIIEMRKVEGGGARNVPTEGQPVTNIDSGFPLETTHNPPSTTNTTNTGQKQEAGILHPSDPPTNLDAYLNAFNESVGINPKPVEVTTGTYAGLTREALARKILQK